MILTEKVMFPVKPVTGQDGWYQIDGVPKDLGYGDIGDWLQDELSGGGKNASVIVEDAMLAGVHDHRDIMSEDPRFNHRAAVATNEGDQYYENEPDFVVVKRHDGELLCAMLINAPEGILLKYIAHTMYPGVHEWQGGADKWTRMDANTAKHYEKDVAEVVAEGIAALAKLEREHEEEMAAHRAEQEKRVAEAEAAAAAKKNAAAAKRATTKKPAVKKKK